MLLLSPDNFNAFEVKGCTEIVKSGGQPEEKIQCLCHRVSARQIRVGQKMSVTIAKN
jgi:hypothetical protein